MNRDSGDRRDSSVLTFCACGRALRWSRAPTCRAARGAADPTAHAPASARARRPPTPPARSASCAPACWRRCPALCTTPVCPHNQPTNHTNIFLCRMSALSNIFKIYVAIQTKRPFSLFLFVMADADTCNTFSQQSLLRLYSVFNIQSYDHTRLHFI